jgi:hypothetical protein
MESSFKFKYNTYDGNCNVVFSFKDFLNRNEKAEFEKVFSDSISNLNSLDLWNFIKDAKESKIELSRFNSTFIKRFENAKWANEMGFLLEILIEQKTENTILEKSLNEKKEICREIPDEEYENFCGNSIALLHGIFERGGFQKEGDIEERTKRYNDRAGYIRPFLKEYCENNILSDITVEKFRLMYLNYLKSINQPEPAEGMIGRQMSLAGYKSTSLRVEGDIKRVYKGLKWLDGLDGGDVSD